MADIPYVTGEFSDELLPEEINRHRKAVAKLHAKLLSRYAHYRIVDNSIRTLRPMVSVYDGVRHLSLGGLVFFTEGSRAGLTYNVSIVHSRQDHFDLFVEAHSDDGRMAYTRLALTLPFDGIDQRIVELLDMLRSE